MTSPCHGTPSPSGVSSAAAPAARRFDGTPAAPAFFAERGGPTNGARPGGGSGDETRSARGCLSEYGLSAEALSHVSPTPAEPQPPRGGIAGRPAPPVSRA